MKKDIAIVILNWNGADMMRRFLPSVIQNSGEKTSIIVADNGSTDNSQEMLEKEFPEIMIIHLDKNYGFAGGYNKALEQVSAKYYLLLNSDIEVPPHWIDPLYNYMEQHSEVIACQPKILHFDHRDTFEYAGACGGYIDYLGYPFCRGRIFSKLEKDKKQYDTPTPIFWATGAALFIKSEVFKEIKGFDADFFAHQEEIDLCWRLQNRGYKIMCIPASKVYHVGGATLNQGNPHKTFLNFRNNLMMLYKNLDEQQLRPIMRKRHLLDLIAALRFLLLGDIKNVKAVLSARKAFKEMLPKLKEKRMINLTAKKIEIIPEMLQSSLLVLFYLKRKKTFSSIKKYLK